MKVTERYCEAVAMDFFLGPFGHFGHNLWVLLLRFIPPESWDSRHRFPWSWIGWHASGPTIDPRVSPSQTFFSYPFKKDWRKTDQKRNFSPYFSLAFSVLSFHNKKGIFILKFVSWDLELTKQDCDSYCCTNLLSVEESDVAMRVSNNPRSISLVVRLLNDSSVRGRRPSFSTEGRCRRWPWWWEDFFLDDLPDSPWKKVKILTFLEFLPNGMKSHIQ